MPFSSETGILGAFYTDPAMSNPSPAGQPSGPAPSPGRAGRDRAEARTTLGALVALSGSHLVNDAMQSLLLALYPLLKATFALTYLQIGLISLAYQSTASVPQPWLGHYNDKNPTPVLLCLALSLEIAGLLTLATAAEYAFVLVAAVLIGLASSVFHPVASPLVRDLSGGRQGLAQSIFQIGGNAGAAFGPLLAALLILPHGLKSLSWLCLPAVIAFVFCFRLANRHGVHRASTAGGPGRPGPQEPAAPRRILVRALAILLVLMFSKYIYLTGIGTYYTFYLIHRFGMTTWASQMYLFAFLFAIAAGTLIGGPIVDRVGEKPVICASILGVAPFTLALPYATLGWTCALSLVIGLILASAFPAILVYAHELLPRRVGLISGLFFGIAFGLGGLGATLLGVAADRFGIVAAFKVCSYLPLLGIAAIFLPISGGRLNPPAR